MQQISQEKSRGKAKFMWTKGSYVPSNNHTLNNLSHEYGLVAKGHMNAYIAT